MKEFRFALAGLYIALNREEETRDNRARFKDFNQVDVGNAEIEHNWRISNSRAKYRVDSQTHSHEFELRKKAFDAVEGGVHLNELEHLGLEELLFLVLFAPDAQNDE